MKYYMAPLEGITNHVFRKTYHKYFYPMDKYFTPFLAPHTKKGFTAKELKDISPENNKGMYTVPQILTNDAEGFVITAKKLQACGYEEVNLNLGCPSKTVANKGRGSGFLIYPDELNRFLEEIFEKLDMKISVKTRIGKENPDEFYRLMEIYNQYPMEELIIHPRIQREFYQNHPHMDMFDLAVKESKNPLCYNGDLFTPSLIRDYQEKYPHIDCIMLGRGILVNPELIRNFRKDGQSLERIRGFHDDLFEIYSNEMSGGKNVLFKMKELWFYMIHTFAESEKYGKQIRKCTDVNQYQRIVDDIFSNCELLCLGE